MKYLLSLMILFTVTVRIPMKGTFEIKNVEEVTPASYHYKLTLTDGKTIYVPTLWTIITEQ